MTHGFVRFQQGIVTSPVAVPASDAAAPRILVVEIAGEAGSTPLRNRLAALEDVRGYDVVVLRGMRASLAQLDDAERHDLIEAFGTECSIGAIRFARYPTLDWVEGAPSDMNEDHLFTLVQELDVHARLLQADAIWSGEHFHFVLPSGMHTDTFVRMGDALGSALEVSRLADWIHYQLPLDALLVIDSATLLPLAQELRVRHLSEFAIDLCAIVVLPLYALSAEECAARLLSATPVTYGSLPTLVSLVSVTSTGEYIRRLEAAALEVGLGQPDSIVLCESSPLRTTSALCHVISSQSRTAECSLCRHDNSYRIEIDASRFAPRVFIGQHVQEIPRADSLEELRELLEAGSRTEAFRLHVTSEHTAKHTLVHVDVRRLLADSSARIRVRASLAQAISDWQPDLLLLHADGSEAELVAMANEISTAASFLVSDFREPLLSPELRSALLRATSVLIITPCIATTRSIRAIVEALQRAASEGASLHLYCFTVLLRPSSGKSLKGIHRRFYIGRTKGLRAAWEIMLPSEEMSPPCPWCNERDLIAESGLAQSFPYFRDRLSRLSSLEGISSCAFLLAQVDADGDDARAGTRATPGAYFGNVSDVAAFIGATAVLTRSLDDWLGKPASLSTRLVFSLPDVLRTFSDPVIVAAFLRSFRRSDIDAPNSVAQMAEAMTELTHVREHDVFGAEMLLATARGLVQAGWHTNGWQIGLATRSRELAALASVVLRTA